MAVTPSGDRLVFILTIMLGLAAVRVFLVMCYLDVKQPLPQGPVGQLEQFSEMEQHRVVLRKLEAERQQKLEQVEQVREVRDVEVAYKKKVDDAGAGKKPAAPDVKSKRESPKESNNDNVGSRTSVTKGRWLHDEIKFLVSPPDGCPMRGEQIYLLSLIISYPKNWEQRQAIRETWGSTDRTEERQDDDARFIKTLFFVGTPPSEPLRSEMANRLTLENNEHGDIIQTSVLESLKMTQPPALRILAAFKWVIINCPQVEHVFIGNDELFVNYPNLIKNLAVRNTPTFYTGRSKRNARPERQKSEWGYVPESLYKGEFFPTFCVSGAGFVVSAEYIGKAYIQALKNPKRAKTFPLGDAFLGIITQELIEAKYRPRYNDYFRKMGGEADYCDLRDSVTIGEFDTPRKQLSAWGNVSTPLDKCPNAFPNTTDIDEWSEGVHNKQYFNTVLQLLANPTAACERNQHTKTHPYLLALVSSQPEHFELRDAIRKTWGAPRYMGPLNAKTLFILGRSHNQTAAMRERVLNEAQTSGDMILSDFNESFHNLTLKVVLGLRWVSKHCNNIKFIYKGDDDMLVNFGRIIEHLEHLPANQAERYFLGHLMQRSPVVRTGAKYYVSREIYPFKYFLPYFSGGGYIFSTATAQALYQASLHTKLIPIDDAFAGILAYRSNISLSGSNDFITTGSRKDACRLRTAFNLHGFRNTEIMIGTWNEFLDPMNKCND